VSVFVVDQQQMPLMPCSEKRARLLLARKRAVVHRRIPFVIRLKDRTCQQSEVQPVALKLDPGSKTSGMAVVRIEHGDEGEVHHALHLVNLSHRGQEVHKALQQRAGYRRRWRSANLRYRQARYANRRRALGWLPPSLRSRVGNVHTWSKRYQRWVPLTRLEVELVTFDSQLMQNPEVSGIDYQRGELVGWEVRAYLLEKFQRRCVYCHATNVPFEIDHVLPRSRGGSDRVSNLVLSCHDCNQAKGDRTASEFGHGEVERQARTPLKDAAAVNATRSALVHALHGLDLPIGTWSGGRTRWNRKRFNVEKDHCLDALCVGNPVGITRGMSRRHSYIHLIQAHGRGSYQRTNVDSSGFPVGYFTRQKRIRGFSTGDLVRAEVPQVSRSNKPLKTAGRHVGRVAVRASGSFRVGKVDGVNARYCIVLQRADGYAYGRAPAQKLNKERLLPPPL